MAEQHQEFVKSGVQVIAVARDTVANARGYFLRHRLPFPCLLDPEHRVYDQYQVESKLVSLGQRPGLFVIDREGIVRFAHVGWQQWDITSCEEVLEVCRGTRCGVEC